ncbi:MAG: 1-deoxy-D-xylulose-5-phosphate reductoisomerase [Candidatus Marinimicrobia bacterium]|jgi:1-deoxy-D-xylulose-5-phosphate reductoisomerase|nr:1-deoxy-D-xylulose-5-phosphate reductoisomerase [Candidatus Neomarinimicrobiota bacterium]
MKKIGILGSTGSIGRNTLKIIENNSDKFELIYITAKTQVELLIEQAKKFKPKYVVIADEDKYSLLKSELTQLNIKVMSGYNSIIEIAGLKEVDVAVNAIVGSKGMQPSVSACKNGVDVALSNKESLVMAGGYLYSLAEKSGTEIFPVDSEHSAIWQCIQGEDSKNIKKLILTGSGGPFLNRDLKTFDKITVKDALKHPNWSMGKKITIDSATMMNKGLEIIEAHHLFKMPQSKIEVVIHPQSIIHSMVEFVDSSVKAQLGLPDMKLPIQYALSYPERYIANWESLDLVKLKKLTFLSPDTEKFPSLKLALNALKLGETYPVVLNVANEQAVYLFIKNKIKFTDIPKIVEKMLNRHDPIKNADIDAILDVENEVSNFVNSIV